MSILDGDVQILNNNAFANREGHRPVAIIVHGTASAGPTTAVNIANYFKSTEGTNNPVSAHYTIDKDGTIVRCNSLGDGAWANGIVEVGHDPVWNAILNMQSDGSFVNPNNVTVSIEHVKFATDNSDPLTDTQKHASFTLIAALCNALGIPKRRLDNRGGITGHFSISPQSRARCPGSYPFDELMIFLQGSTTFDENSPLFSTYFMKISPTSWMCKKTGKHITNGMLQYYKTISFDPNTQLPCIGLPVTEEIPVLRPDKAPLAYLICERGALIYDPAHINDHPPGSGSVYLGHIDQGIILSALPKH